MDSLNITEDALSGLNITEDALSDTVTVHGLTETRARSLRKLVTRALGVKLGVISVRPPCARHLFQVRLYLPKQFDMSESRGKVLGVIAAWSVA